MAIFPRYSNDSRHLITGIFFPQIIKVGSVWVVYVPLFVILKLLHFSTLTINFAQVHVPNFGGLSGSEDRGGGDNSIQFMNFWRVGDKSFK